MARSENLRFFIPEEKKGGLYEVIPQTFETDTQRQSPTHQNTEGSRPGYGKSARNPKQRNAFGHGRGY